MSRIEYKNSGIFWQPFIPKSWHVTRLKYILKKLSREKGADDELLVCSNSGDIKKRGDSRLGLVANSNDIYQGVRSGDLLIHGMDTWHGAIAVSKFDGMCTPVVHVCDSSQNKEYVAAYLRNMASQQIFKLISNGVRQNTSDFRSWDKFSRIPIPLPPLVEQEKIVSYLKSKTSKIDEAILAKGEQIKLLQELKEAEIANVITRGLNPDIKMKDSEISWIGQIPEHWKVKRIASLFTGKVDVNSEFVYKHAFKFYYGTLVPKEELGEIEDYKSVYIKYSIIKQNDILINGLNLNYDFVSQRVAIAPTDGIITSTYIVVRPRKNTNALYYTYLFKTMDNMKLFHGMGKGIRLTLSFDELKKQLIPVPSPDEQKVIVAYIESKCNKINSLIKDLETEIEYLKEYKQKLIADCVTGQINVQSEQ